MALRPGNPLDRQALIWVALPALETASPTRRDSPSRKPRVARSVHIGDWASGALANKTYRERTIRARLAPIPEKSRAPKSERHGRVVPWSTKFIVCHNPKRLGERPGSPSQGACPSRPHPKVVYRAARRVAHA